MVLGRLTLSLVDLSKCFLYVSVVLGFFLAYSGFIPTTQKHAHQRIRFMVHSKLTTGVNLSVNGSCR